MEKITLSIFVPCFNEEKNITNALNNIKEAAKNISYEILVADDGSKDETVAMVEKFKSDNPNLNTKIFHTENNQGIGFNYYAIAHKASGKYYMLVNGDADFPSDTIKKILSNLGKADMVISYFPGKNDKRTLLRRLFSKIFVIILNLITFNNLKYYNGPTLHLLDNVKLHKASTFHFSYQAELIANLINLKKTYVEVQVESIDTGGMAKVITPYNILSLGKSIITIFLNQLTHLTKKLFK